MTVQQFWKGLLMILISIVVTALSQTPLDVAMLVVTGIAAILPYIGKNLFAIWPSTSPTGAFNLQNVLSSLFILIGSGLTEYLAMIVVNGVIVWPVLLKVVGSITLTYIVTTWLSPPANKSRKLFAKTV